MTFDFKRQKVVEENTSITAELAAARKYTG